MKLKIYRIRFSFGNKKPLEIDKGFFFAKRLKNCVFACFFAIINAC